MIGDCVIYNCVRVVHNCYWIKNLIYITRFYISSCLFCVREAVVLLHAVLHQNGFYLTLQLSLLVLGLVVCAFDVMATGSAPFPTYLNGLDCCLNV